MPKKSAKSTKPAEASKLAERVDAHTPELGPAAGVAGIIAQLDELKRESAQRWHKRQSKQLPSAGTVRSLTDDCAPGDGATVAVNQREALARILRFATGVEPNTDVLQQLLAYGARAYWKA